MKSKTVLIQASARSEGDTSVVSNYLKTEFGMDLIDLKTLNINPFDYDNNNQDDDFLPTINKLIEDYNYWVFLSPVYWYSISARMKIFLDRISDLLMWNKELGRKIRGKNMALISVSNSSLDNPHFGLPISLSAEYLSMNYMGHNHCIVVRGNLPEEETEKLQELFRSSLIS